MTHLARKVGTSRERCSLARCNKVLGYYFGNSMQRIAAVAGILPAVPAMAAAQAYQPVISLH